MGTPSPIIKEDGGSKKKNSKRRAVACKSCHSLKVKCIPSDPNDLSSPCVRCLKTKKQCEIDLNHSRKRKKPEDRVTELEMRVEKLSHQLQQQTETNSPMSTSSESTRTHNFTPERSFSTLTPQFYQNSSEAPTQPAAALTSNSVNNKNFPGTLKFVSENDQFANGTNGGNPPPSKKQKKPLTKEQQIDELFGSNILSEISTSVTANADARFHKVYKPATDIIDAGLLTLEEAKKRLETYHRDIYAKYPFIKVSENFEELRKNEPMLFNAVMTVVGIQEKSSNAADFDRDLDIALIALKESLNDFMIVGNKTIELLKCLLLLSIWYNSPELFHHRRYHLLSSICITMVQDLGLTGRPYYVVNKTEGSFKRSAVLEDPQKDEYRCLVLGVYTSNIAFCLFLRRRLQVTWSPYMEESYQHLRNGTDEKYKTVANIAKISSILERIHLRVDMKDQDDPLLVEYLLQEIEMFKTESHTMPSNVVSSFISSIEAYLYSRFTAPEYCFKCLNACGNALSYFSKVEVSEMAAVPLILFGRLMYCFALMLKTTNYLRLEFDFESIRELMSTLKTCSVQYPKNFMLVKVRLLFYFYLTTFAKNEDTFNNLNDVPSDTLAQKVAREHNANHPVAVPILPGSMSAQNLELPSRSQRLSFSLGQSSNLWNNMAHPQSGRSSEPTQPTNSLGGFQHSQQDNITFNNNWAGFAGTQQPNANYDNQLNPELNNEPIYSRLDMLSDATVKGFSELNVGEFLNNENDFWKNFDYKDDQFFL